MIKMAITLPIFFASIVSFNPSSCNKDRREVNQNSKSVLIGKTWVADEIRIQLSDNTNSYYKRNHSGNEYDSDSLTFESNGKGQYYYDGEVYPIKWNFTDAAKSKMTIVINQPPTPVTIYLENIHITETYFKYSQYNLGGGLTYLASCTRIPN